MAAKLREKDGIYWVVVHHRGCRKWKKICRRIGVSRAFSGPKTATYVKSAGEIRLARPVGDTT